jgi:hypothetical protein
MIEKGVLEGLYGRFPGPAGYPLLSKFDHSNWQVNWQVNWQTKTPKSGPKRSLIFFSGK